MLPKLAFDPATELSTGDSGGQESCLVQRIFLNSWPSCKCFWAPPSRVGSEMHLDSHLNLPRREIPRDAAEVGVHPGDRAFNRRFRRSGVLSCTKNFSWPSCK